MLVFVAVSVAVMTANMVNHVGALQAATSNDYAGAFGQRSADALAMLFLDLHAHGYLIAGIFFGLWLLPLGYMLFRSNAVPRALAGLVMIGSTGYVADVVAYFVFPAFEETLTPILLLPSILAEFSLIVWLLARGLDVRKPLDYAPASGEPVGASI
jgi:hypothetical protein